MLASIVVRTPTRAPSHSATHFQGISGGAVAIASGVTTLLAARSYEGRLTSSTATTRIWGRMTKIGVGATQFSSSWKLTMMVVVRQGGWWDTWIQGVRGRQRICTCCNLVCTFIFFVICEHQ